MPTDRIENANESGSLFRIRYDWIDGTSWFMGLIAVLFLGECIYMGHLFYELQDWAAEAAIVFVFTLLSYFLSAHILNSTAIVGTQEELRISHGPLPWDGPSAIRIPDIKRFEMREMKARPHHAFYCIRQDGRKTNLFPGVTIFRPGKAKDCVLALTSWLEPSYSVEIKLINGAATFR